MNHEKSLTAQEEMWKRIRKRLDEIVEREAKKDFPTSDKEE